MSRRKKVEGATESRAMVSEMMKIIVHDKAASLCETFVCDSLLVENSMRYFAPVIREQRAKGGSILISVNCDVDIFRWLVSYISMASPSINVGNVVSLILSSDFLGIASLRREGLAFFRQQMSTVIMSDVNLDHITDAMLDEVVRDMTFGSLCSCIMDVLIACTGASEDIIVSGAPGAVQRVCPNRQFLTRVIVSASNIFTEKWCGDVGHGVVRCSSCSLYYNQLLPASCLNSNGLLDARGFISSSHVPSAGCFCSAALSEFNFAVASVNSRTVPSLYGRALNLLERREDSPFRSFLNGKEVLSLLFMANQQAVLRGSTLLAFRDSPLSSAVDAIDAPRTRLLLVFCLPQRSDRVQLTEPRGDRGSQCRESSFGENASGWGAAESEWVADRMGAVEGVLTVPNDPESCANDSVNVALGVIDEHERHVLFSHQPLVSNETRNPRVSRAIVAKRGR